MTPWSPRSPLTPEDRPNVRMMISGRPLVGYISPQSAPARYRPVAASLADDLVGPPNGLSLIPPVRTSGRGWQVSRVLRRAPLNRSPSPCWRPTDDIDRPLPDATNPLTRHTSADPLARRPGSSGQSLTTAGVLRSRPRPAETTDVTADDEVTSQ